MAHQLVQAHIQTPEVLLQLSTELGQNVRKFGHGNRTFDQGSSQPNAVLTSMLQGLRAACRSIKLIEKLEMHMGAEVIQNERALVR